MSFSVPISTSPGTFAGHTHIVMSTAKGSNCPCGKRAQATLISSRGRTLRYYCMKCSVIVLDAVEVVRIEDVASGYVSSPLVDLVVREGGVSACTIVAVLVPDLRDLCAARVGSFGFGNTPADSDDFDRCYRALSMIVDGPARLDDVAKFYPNWQRLVENWAEIASLYEKTFKNGRSPKLTKRIQELTR